MIIEVLLTALNKLLVDMELAGQFATAVVGTFDMAQQNMEVCLRRASKHVALRKWQLVRVVRRR